MSKRIYVNKKCELTMIGDAFQELGYRCWRVRTQCDCDKINQGNRRDGILVTSGDALLAEIVRCKGCKRLYDDGAGGQRVI